MRSRHIGRKPDMLPHILRTYPSDVKQHPVQRDATETKTRSVGSYRKGGQQMEEKVAIIGLFIHDPSAAERVNDILHKHADRIIGRMGVPYRERGMNIMSIIVQASSDEVSALSGTLGRIEGVTVKTMQTPI